MSWLRPLQPFNETTGSLPNQLLGWTGNTLLNGAAAAVGGLVVAGSIFGVMKSAGYQRPARLMFEAIPLAIAAAGVTVVIGVSAIALLILGASLKALTSR